MSNNDWYNQLSSKGANNASRPDDSIRLTPASPPDTIILSGKSRPASPWWLGDRVLNFLSGFGMGVILAFVVEYGTGNALVWLVLAASSASFAAAYFAKKRFGDSTEFETHTGWVIAGVAMSMLVAPLIVTPQCGFWNDKCKPAVQHKAISHVR